MQPIARIFEEAVRLQQRGRVREAAGRHEMVLRQDPYHLGSLQLLGVIHAQQGRLEQALALLGKAVERHPSASDAHNNIGMILQAMDRNADAVAHYEKALAINPRYAVACNNMGIALASLDRHDEAIASYRRALTIQPRYPEAMNNLGSALQATQQYPEAAGQLAAALALRPDFHEARMNLGMVLAAMNRLDDAIAELRAVLRARPDDFVAHLNLAGLLQGMNRHDDALVHYTRARDARPGDAAAEAGLGVALLEMGRIDAARQCFERALSIDPRHARYYANLANTLRFTHDNRHLAAMLALTQDRSSLADEQQIFLDFSLGKALADIGEHERSFQHLVRANALKRQSGYDEARMLGPVERAHHVFTPALMRRHEGAGHPSPVPIFIVGMPRSGSTLVEQILASHPLVFAAGEVLAFRQAMRAAGAHTRTQPFPDSVPSLTDPQIRDVAARYLTAMQAMVPADAHPAPRSGTQRITDKMLFNFRCVGLIHLAFPNARIIHTCRNPIDTCLSCFALNFLNSPQMYDLGELGRYYRAYTELMQHWRSLLPPGVMLDVHYEDMVADFEPQARRMIAHCGLEWDPACLAFHTTQRPVKTLSVAQVRQPVYRSSVGRWRPRDDLLRPLLDALGPALVAGHPRQPPGREAPGP
ncbi:MAG TPA: sulfotransferase [Acetobacteraceae bacterium]|nr:sulfotransferase [Acetobacteraceae bacterium]